MKHCASAAQQQPEICKLAVDHTTQIDACNKSRSERGNSLESALDRKRPCLPEISKYKTFAEEGKPSMEGIAGVCHDRRTGVAREQPEARGLKAAFIQHGKGRTRKINPGRKK
eukprot:1137222-Pelagomonas_calceolata.AAC.7